MKKFFTDPLNNGLGVLVVLALIFATVWAGGKASAPVPQGVLAGGTSNVTGNLTVSGTVTGATIVGTSETFTNNPTVNGVSAMTCTGAAGASGVVTGTLIAHGFATTPTMIVLTAGPVVTESTQFSQTAFIQASNATSFSVGLTAGTLASFPISWMACK